jgi:glyoxylase I family protein
VEDIEKTMAFLIPKGIICEPIRIDEFTEKRFTFTEDPDGLPIELYEI